MEPACLPAILKGHDDGDMEKKDEMRMKTMKMLKMKTMKMLKMKKRTVVTTMYRVFSVYSLVTMEEVGFHSSRHP
ncbi:hypothetical protein L6452_17750 [Arctium lappa]|uniref:Uncharacterized protein n=1 Tax=Arctium lappa TaxID=4217 RepID=A0ACB9C4C1_ARCLA|nr:hypothetical protein L6452_17750 [Arctium lappa]